MHIGGKVLPSINSASRGILVTFFIILKQHHMFWLNFAYFYYIFLIGMEEKKIYHQKYLS